MDPTGELIAHEWIFPEPGTSAPYAVIRHLPVKRNGVEVMAYRVVTWAEPRELILDGYFPTLRDAAKACHIDALARVIRPALNEQRRFERANI